MAKVNPFRETGTVSKSMNVTSINLDEPDGSESVTDYEPDEKSPPKQKKKVKSKEKKLVLEELFQHLLHFSEDILPTALYDPMKWCHISIQSSLKHIAETEEMIRDANNTELLVLKKNLEVWERHQQTSISKSRLRYSLYLYKYAGDVFYFAFHQNRAILPEIRKHLDPAFQAQFGSSRLCKTRALLKLYLEQFSQIEDFLSMLPQIYRSEVLAGIICDFLSPYLKNEREKIVEELTKLLSSPDYPENQVSLMMLARDDCLFKPIILDCMFKYMFTDLSGKATRASTSSSKNVATTGENNRFSEDSAIKHRLKLFLDAEPDLLARACIATENLPTSLFDIIAQGLDTISWRVMYNRSKIFKNFRPPLFDDKDPTLSLPVQYFRFFLKMKQFPSSHTLLERVKTTFGKAGQSHDLNQEFWVELFRLFAE